MKQKTALFFVTGISILALGSLILWYALTSEPQNVRNPRVPVILKTTENITNFWALLEEGVLQAGEDFGIDVEVIGPRTEAHIDEQIELLKSVLDSRPDAVILAATDYFRLVPLAKEAREKRIPLVTVDSFIASDDALSRIGTDNFEAGKKVGQFLRTLIDPGSPIAIVSYVRDSSTARDRERGVLSALSDEYPVLETVYTSNDLEKTRVETLRLLETYPQLKGIVALNEPSAHGVIPAIHASGKKDRVALVTIDSNVDIIHAIENGEVRGTVVQKPYTMGYIAVKAVRELIEGRRVAETIDTGSVLITRENLYDIVNQKLLFPLEQIELPPPAFSLER